MLRHVLPLLLFCLPALGQVSFDPPRELTDGFPGYLAFATTVDQDGDGDQDIIAAEKYGVRVLVWENQGAGNFIKRPEWLREEVDWEVVGLADWNGDGRLDVWLKEDVYGDLSTSMTRRFRIATGLANGSFAEPQLLGEHVSEEIDTSVDVWVAEMTGDSHPDIIGSEGVYVADASGHFATPPVKLPLDEFAGGQRGDIIAFDAGEDGTIDLLRGGFASDLRLNFIRNLGPAGFAEPVPLLTRDEDTGCLSFCVVPSESGHRVVVLEEDGPEAALSLRSFTIAADGTLTEQDSLVLPQVVEGRKVDWLSLRSTSTGGTFILSISSEPGMSPVTRVHEVTWDGSELGLITLSSHAGVSWWWQPAVVELNGDASPDLLLPISGAWVGRGTPDRILWHAGNPEGFSNAPAVIARGEGNIRLHEVGDFDGDGDADVLAGNTALLENSYYGSDRLELWRSTGGNLERTSIPVGRDQIEVIGVADLVGEVGTWHPEDPNHGAGWPAGRLDFLARTYQAAPETSRYEWYLQDSTGTFHRWTAASTPAESYELEVIGWIDWDGDGTKDLLTIDGFPGFRTVSIQKGNGFGFREPQMVVALPLQDTVAPQWADIDHDGDPDLVGCGYIFGDKPGYWVENDGDGGVDAIRSLNHDVAVVPDLDGDGYRDFTTLGKVLLSRPGPAFEARTLPSIGLPGYTRDHFADLDGDGDLDYLATLSVASYEHTRIFWWENRGGAHFFPQEIEPATNLVAPLRTAWREHMRTGDIDGDGSADLVVGSYQSGRLEWIPVRRRAGSAAYANWMSDAGLTGHSAGPGSDWDRDGVLNWDEFAFGADPTAADSGHPGRPRIEREGDALHFTFYRRTDALSAGLSYPLQRSTDLSEWEAWTPGLEVEPASNGYERVFIPVAGGESMEFFRVAVPEAP
jgi:hypothetical protein